STHNAGVGGSSPPITTRYPSLHVQSCLIVQEHANALKEAILETAREEMLSHAADQRVILALDDIRPGLRSEQQKTSLNELPKLTAAEKQQLQAHDSEDDIPNEDSEANAIIDME
ncbi:hypothetical protein M3S_J68, partial [Sorghum bicolor]